MEINKFKKIGKNKYKVFLDDSQLLLYEDIILKYNLLINKDISIELIDKIIDENRYYESYYIALNYIDIKMRSKKEIKDYLNKKDFDKKYIDFAINKLDGLGLLNSNKYIEAFINDKINLSNDGPYKIKRNLLEFDFNEDDVDKYLNNIDKNVWNEKIVKIINKKTSIMKNKSYYMIINKIKNDLYNLGYDKDIIDNNLSNIKYDNSNIIKEFNKISNKYTDKKKIINYLLRKGYSYEEINNCFINE